MSRKIPDEVVKQARQELFDMKTNSLKLKEVKQ